MPGLPPKLSFRPLPPLLLTPKVDGDLLNEKPPLLLGAGLPPALAAPPSVFFDWPKENPDAAAEPGRPLLPLPPEAAAGDAAAADDDDGVVGLAKLKPVGLAAALAAKAG
jgi:hypothetical protein